MSQTSSGRPIWMKEVVGTREERQEPMHILQPLVPLPHVAQLISPTALQSGLGFSPHKGLQSPIEQRPAQPFVGNGSHPRLPGVRHLLMPQSFGNEMKFDPVRRQYSAQDKPPHTTPALAFSPILLPARAESQPSGSNLSTPKQNAPDFGRRWAGDEIEKLGPPVFLPPSGHQGLPRNIAQQKSPPPRSFGPSGFPFPHPTTTPPKASTNSFERPGGSPEEQVTAGTSGQGNKHPRSTDAWASPSNRQEWGMTKAGKPRKRLALACLNCRQKKIRCHPNPRTRRCNHCERTGSSCRFEGGSRHSNPGAPYRDQTLQPALTPDGALTDSKHPKRTADEMSPSYSNPQSRPNTSTGMKPSIHRLLSSPEESTASKMRPLKRQRADTEPLDDTHGSRVFGHRSTYGPTSNPVEGRVLLEVIEDPFLNFPFTVEYLDLYFTHINQATYSMFPRTHFMTWAQSGVEKSPDDNMVIYAMLAMGSKFSTRPERAAHGANCARIARDAEQRCCARFSSQLVQTRLILALILFAEGQKYEAWDFCGRASRMATGLKYNTETMLASESAAENRPIYGLTGSALLECRRRTFWSVYILDHFTSFCAGRLSAMRNDCFLRLPCLERSFDQLNVPETPFFTTGTEALGQLETHSLGNMAYLIVMASTWNDLLQNLYLSRQRAPGENAEYERFYADRTKQLQVFAAKVPAHLNFTEANIEQALAAGYIGTLTSLQALYLMGLMKLNRHCAWSELSQESRARNMKLSQKYAREMLNATGLLAQIHRRKTSEGAGWIFSTPFLGYSIISAVDILTSIGSLQDLHADMSLLKGSIEVMNELGKYWASARAQVDMIQERLQALEAALSEAPTERTVFVASDALEIPFGNDVDLFFAPPLEMRLAVLGLEAHVQSGGIVTIREPSTYAEGAEPVKRPPGDWDGRV